jgi:hypothetical protein
MRTDLREREGERERGEKGRLKEEWAWKNWRSRWKLRSRLWKFGNEKGGRRGRK